MACGTGSTASAYVGWMTGRLKRKVIVKPKGGKLEIQSKMTEMGEETIMKGPAKMIFNGKIF